MRLVLASKSPRRAEILRMLRHPFEIVDPACDEICRGDAVLRVTRSALRKADSVYQKMPDAWVLGADTLVEQGGAVLGKPVDVGQAADMLRALSGKRHWVHTGVALIGPDKRYTYVESAKVSFVAMDERFIRAYVASGEPMDKAGAYAIQGAAAAYIDRVEGDYYAIIGLPLCRVRTMLSVVGICDADE